MPGIQDRVNFFNAAVEQQTQEAARVYQSVPPIWLVAPPGKQLTPVQQVAGTGIGRDGPPPLVQAVVNDDAAEVSRLMTAYQRAVRAQNPAYTVGQVSHELDGIVNGRWKHYRLAQAAAAHEAQQRSAQRRQLLRQRQLEEGEDLEPYAAEQALLDSCTYVEVREVAERLELSRGTTLLVLAIRLARPEAVRALLACGADPGLHDRRKLRDISRAGGILGVDFIAKDGRRLGWVGATERELQLRRQAVQDWLKEHACTGAHQFSLQFRLQPGLAERIEGLLAEGAQAVDADAAQQGQGPAASDVQPACIDSTGEASHSRPSTPRPVDKVSPTVADSPADLPAQQQATAAVQEVPAQELEQQHGVQHQGPPSQLQLEEPSQHSMSPPPQVLSQQQPPQPAPSLPESPLQQQRPQPVQQLSTPSPVQPQQQVQQLLLTSEEPPLPQQPPQRIPSSARRQLRLADTDPLPSAPTSQPAAAAAPHQAPAKPPGDAAAGTATGATAAAAAAAINVQQAVPAGVGQTPAPSRSSSAKSCMRRALDVASGNSLLFEARPPKPAAHEQPMDEQMAPVDDEPVPSPPPLPTTTTAAAPGGQPAGSGSGNAGPVPAARQAGREATSHVSAAAMCARPAAPVGTRQRHVRRAAQAGEQQALASLSPSAVPSRVEPVQQPEPKAATLQDELLTSAANLSLLAALFAWLLLPPLLLWHW